jgi:hypothetical protein
MLEGISDTFYKNIDYDDDFQFYKKSIATPYRDIFILNSIVETEIEDIILFMYGVIRMLRH